MAATLAVLCAVPVDHSGRVSIPAQKGPGSRRDVGQFSVHSTARSQEFRNRLGDALPPAADKDLHVRHAVATVSLINKGHLRPLIRQVRTGRTSPARISAMCPSRNFHSIVDCGLKMAAFGREMIISIISSKRALNRSRVSELERLFFGHLQQRCLFQLVLAEIRLAQFDL
jgi:hypothetical protein